MNDYEYPNAAHVEYFRFLIESISAGLNRWRSAAGRMDSRLVRVPHRLRWYRIYRWDVALDKKGRSIYLYDDESISFVKERRWLWPTRRRYPLVPAQMPLVAINNLLAVRASICAPSVQEMRMRSEGAL